MFASCLASAVGVASMDNADDGHPTASVIDSVDDAVSTTACAVSIVERWTEPLADALRAVEQRPNDEFVRRERDRLGQVLGELPSSCR